MDSNQNLKKTNYIKVGHVSDAHGLKGEIYILIDSGDISWIDDLENVLLGAGTQQKSYSVKKIKPFKKGFIATLDGITNRNESELLRKKEVLVDSELFISDDGEIPYLSELLGFTVEDKNLGLVGTIQDFSTNSQQDLLIIQNDQLKKKIEIPFVKEFVIDIFFEEKKIFMDLPEGLLTINEKD